MSRPMATVLFRICSWKCHWTLSVGGKFIILASLPFSVLFLQLTAVWPATVVIIDHGEWEKKGPVAARMKGGDKIGAKPKTDIGVMMLDLQSDHFCSHKQGCCFWNLLDSETRAQISWVFQLESLNQGPSANSVFSVTERHPHPVVQLPKLVSLILELVGWSVGPWGPLPDLQHWRGGAWYWYCRPAFCHSVPWSQSRSTSMPKKFGR